MNFCHKNAGKGRFETGVLMQFQNDLILSFQNHKYAQLLKQILRHSCRFKTLQFQGFKTMRFLCFKTLENSAKVTASKGKNLYIFVILSPFLPF